MAALKESRQVRLRCNLILDGKFRTRGQLLSIDELPEHLRTETYIETDLTNRDGEVLLLRGLTFMTKPTPASDGVPTSYPRSLAAGELLDLSDVPASRRDSLEEGKDYKIVWSEEDRHAVRKAEEEAFLAQFQPKAVPAFRHGSL